MNWIDITLLVFAIICTIFGVAMIASAIKDHRQAMIYRTTAKAIAELINYELDLMTQHLRNGGVYVKEKNESNKKNENGNK